MTHKKSVTDTLELLCVIEQIVRFVLVQKSILDCYIWLRRGSKDRVAVREKQGWCGADQTPPAEFESNHLCGAEPGSDSGSIHSSDLVLTLLPLRLHSLTQPRPSTLLQNRTERLRTNGVSRTCQLGDSSDRAYTCHLRAGFGRREASTVHRVCGETGEESRNRVFLVMLYTHPDLTNLLKPIACRYREWTLGLRLICRTMNAVLEPLVLNRLTLNREDLLSGASGIHEMLETIASGTASPIAKYTKSLFIGSLHDVSSAADSDESDMAGGPIYPEEYETHNYDEEVENDGEDEGDPSLYGSRHDLGQHIQGIFSYLEDVEDVAAEDDLANFQDDDAETILRVSRLIRDALIKFSTLESFRYDVFGF